MEDVLIPNFGKYYKWCCPERGAFVESIYDYEQPCTSRPKKK